MRSGQAPSSQLFIALPYRPAETDFSVVDAQIEAAVGIGADPRLVGDRRALAAIVGKWNEGSLRALLTGRPLLRLHVPSRALGSAQTLPFVGIAEHIAELIHCFEIGLSIARLGDQEANLHEGEDDSD